MGWLQVFDTLGTCRRTHTQSRARIHTHTHFVFLSLRLSVCPFLFLLSLCFVLSFGLQGRYECLQCFFTMTSYLCLLFLSFVCLNCSHVYLCLGIIHIFFYLCLQTLYTATTYAGYVGVLTGQKPNAFTITIDQRGVPSKYLYFFSFFFFLSNVLSLCLFVKNMRL